MSFQENLRTLRLTRGFTQPALAEKADIEQSYLSKLENGRSKPSEDVLGRLASALETTPEALANGDDHENERPWLRRTLIATALLATVIVAFIAGRVSVLYPLSISQILSGQSRSAELTRVMMQLMPAKMDINDVHASSNTLTVIGWVPDRAILDAYMGTVQSRFGGQFEDIRLSGELRNGQRTFILRYQPDWSRIDIKADAADQPVSTH